MATSFERGKRLAFDVGKVRVGVASCDPDGILAVPTETLPRQDEAELSARISELLQEYSPSKIYVGLPMNLRNETTASTSDAVEFATWLSRATATPIYLVDERLTTSRAAAALRQAGKTARTSRGIIDQQAAVEILESALNLEKQSQSAGVLLEHYER